jgi:thioredoxin 1
MEIIIKKIMEKLPTFLKVPLQALYTRLQGLLPSGVSPVTLIMGFMLIYQIWSKFQPFPGENEPDSVVKSIKSGAEWKDLCSDEKNKNKIIIIDFYAIWCPPCKVAAPKYHKLAERYSVNDNVVFTKCNVDIGREVAQICHVSSMPTFKIFKNNQEIASITGYNENKLVADIDAALK